MELFLLPLYSTTTHHNLHKFFKGWHNSYSHEVNQYKPDLRDQSVVTNKKDFELLFDRAWKNWVSPESVLKIWSAVGITAAGLDPYTINDSAFMATGAEKPRPLATPQNPMELSLPTSMGITRQGIREASSECEVASCRVSVALLNKLPQGVRELGLFAGAADGVEASRNRDSKKQAQGL